MVAVLGAGSFGTTIANILAEQNDVLLYSRREEVVMQVNEQHQCRNTPMSHRVTATTDLADICKRCTLIFPIVPSQSFRALMRDCAPYLHPYHILIHGTKGFDVTYPYVEGERRPKMGREYVHTMSEVILQETAVLRVGCLSGPNLSAEIMNGDPCATVIASRFTEVIRVGQEALRTKRFLVYGSHEITAAELAGAMKNIFAIASGMLGGLGMGYNMRALLITRGLSEMATLGKALGADPRGFLGVAGIGDLVATASSQTSRNYQVGVRIAQGEHVDDIARTIEEVAEGVRTTQIIKQIADYYHVHTPIVQTIHQVLWGSFPIERAIEYLLTYPYAADVDFI